MESHNYSSLVMKTFVQTWPPRWIMLTTTSSSNILHDICCSTAWQFNSVICRWRRQNLAHEHCAGTQKIWLRGFGVCCTLFFILKLRWKPLCLLQLGRFCNRYRVAYAADPDSDCSSHKVLYIAAVVRMELQFAQSLLPTLSTAWILQEGGIFCCPHSWHLWQQWTRSQKPACEWTKAPVSPLQRIKALGECVKM